jgi:hypothetical protein
MRADRNSFRERVTLYPRALAKRTLVFPRLRSLSATTGKKIAEEQMKIFQVMVNTDNG